MAFSEMLRRVALVRTDVSEELRASIIRVTRGELGTTLAVTSRFLQEPHGVTSQKTPFLNKANDNKNVENAIEHT
jgi:hypothetical protein